MRDFESTYPNPTILITGGTGTLGQALAQHFVLNHPQVKIIIYSRNENAQVEMKRRFPNPKYNIRYFIGDVRDYDRLYWAMHGAHYVIHCAALKHVDVCETDPFEAVQTNIIGAQNIIKCAVDLSVDKVIAISSDKAVNPINTYGATKLCADRMFLAAPTYAGASGTKFAIARPGNYAGSSGSVIPLFTSLKTQGVGVVPITHHNMTRFFIDLPTMTQHVIHYLKNMEGGEVYIPKMGAVRIVELADAIYPEATKEYIGLRPGEKLHEDMICPHEVPYTYDKKGYYYIHQYREGVIKVPSDFTYNSGDTKWLVDPKTIL